ncbi:uncharacterized protein LOC127429623 [Myxocyprinus asiaticus]|uniref:uncharacterized protein LOC127429623 n=1 Tax=Myxocyprinus asiaticus TaxID=70543 RepID=UPI002222545D|nr:uncharacterized protein LOC127429623 [Myxocyprinus asiaticus]
MRLHFQNVEFDQTAQIYVYIKKCFTGDAIFTSGTLPLSFICCSGVYCVCLCLSDLLESVLRCMQVCRRLLVVLSSDCLCEKSISLLECRLCLYLHHTFRTPVITVRRHMLSAPCVDIMELRNSSTRIHWHGARSERANSRFWKLLRLALPLRPLALGKRLIDSTSSHSDLASLATRYTQAQLVSLRHNQQSKALGVSRGNGIRHLGARERSGRGCEQNGRGCAICVSFQESYRIWGGVITPQWNTHLHQPAANGMIPHVTHNSNTEPGNEPGNDLCPCEPINNNQTNELQTTHC